MNLAAVKDQLYIESTRAQELARDHETKDREIHSLHEEVQKGRGRIKDSHFDKQRLEKTIIDLRQELREFQRRQTTRSTTSSLSRSNSKSSANDAAEDAERSDSVDSNSKPGGLRELRLGRGLSRTNTGGGPVQVFSKRTSSLMYSTATSSAENLAAVPTSPNHSPSASMPTLPKGASPPENDSLLLQLASAKTAEAVARQELEELRARFDAMRKMMTAVTPPIHTQTDPIAAGVPMSAQSLPSLRAADTPIAQSAPAMVASSFGFFGWGKRS
jgi:hypothetical protein